MYVPPRPSARDDPRFALRLGLVTVLGFLAVIVLKPSLPAMSVALPIGLAATQRKAFNIGKALGSAVALAVVAWSIAWLVGATRAVPGVLLVLMFGLFWLGFYITRRSGSPLGMLILIAAVLMSIAGMKAPYMLTFVRDGFVTGCLVAGGAVTVASLLIPPATRERHVDALRPAPGHYGAGAAIRAAVLMALCFWLYATLPMQDMMLGIAAVFPLIFPTRDEAFAEAWERIWATVLGSLAAVAVLMALQVSAHILVLIWLAFFLGWAFGEGMMQGRASAPLYQFALSVAAVLVITSLTTSTPASAVVSRVVLTLIGGVAAALAVAVLDWALLAPLRHEDDYSPHPAVQRRRFGREYS